MTSSRNIGIVVFSYALGVTPPVHTFPEHTFYSSRSSSVRWLRGTHVSNPPSVRARIT